MATFVDEIGRFITIQIYVLCNGIRYIFSTNNANTGASI